MKTKELENTEVLKVLEALVDQNVDKNVTLNLPSFCNSCCDVGQRKEGISVSIWQ